MLFLSRDKSPSFLIVPGFEEIVQTIHGNIPKVVRPIWVKFIACAEGSGGIESPHMPSRRGETVAMGKLETSVTAKKTGLPEQEIIDFLMNHEGCGVEFVPVEEVDLEAENDEGFFVTHATGFHCQLCNAPLKNAQAKAGHRTSKKHRMALKVALAAVQETMQETT